MENGLLPSYTMDPKLRKYGLRGFSISFRVRVRVDFIL